MIIEFYIILTWLYYEVKVRNEISLFFGEISIFIKNNPIFCNRTGKVFKNYSFYYLVLNLMLRYPTNIYHVVFTNKTCQNVFLFCLEN